MFCTSWPPGSSPDFDILSSFYDKGGVWPWWKYCPTCPLINDCLTLLVLLVRWRKLHRAELSDLSPSPLTWDSTSDQLVRHETTLLINFPRLAFFWSISRDWISAAKFQPSTERRLAGNFWKMSSAWKFTSVIKFRIFEMGKLFKITFQTLHRNFASINTIASP